MSPACSAPLSDLWCPLLCAARRKPQGPEKVVCTVLREGISPRAASPFYLVLGAESGDTPTHGSQSRAHGCGEVPAAEQSQS